MKLGSSSLSKNTHLLKSVKYRHLYLLFLYSLNLLSWYFFYVVRHDDI